MNIAVLGAGAWGTALAIALSAQHSVWLWTRDAQQCARMAQMRGNVRYLPGIAFPDGLRVAPDLVQALEGSDLAIVGVTLAGLRATLRQLVQLRSRIPVVGLCKGFEAGSACLPHQVAASELGDAAIWGVLSGPSFAQEVARGIPAAVTLAARDASFARQLARQLHSPRLRIYSSDDVTGVEVGGAVKNVIAIAAGISDGLGFGESARAALVTRGLAEITRLGLRMGGRADTFMGLAGMGDLILTCTGNLSRNRQVGLRLAGGKSLPVILDELGHVAEGVHTSSEVLKLAREKSVEMPIVQAVCNVLHEQVAPEIAVEQLLAREPKTEF